jgi:hypothetical protein
MSLVPSALLRFDLLPLLQYLIGGGQAFAPENVRVPSDDLLTDPLDDVIQVEVLALLGDAGLEHDLH